MDENYENNSKEPQRNDGRSAAHMKGCASFGLHGGHCVIYFQFGFHGSIISLAALRVRARVRAPRASRLSPIGVFLTSLGGFSAASFQQHLVIITTISPGSLSFGCGVNITLQLSLVTVTAP